MLLRVWLRRLIAIHLKTLKYNNSMIDLTKLTKEGFGMTKEDVLFSLLERYIKEEKEWRDENGGDEFEDYDNTPEENFKYAVESMAKDIESYTTKEHDFRPVIEVRFRLRPRPI